MTPRWIPTTGEVHDEFVMAQAKFKGVNIRFASDKFKAWIDGRDAKLVKATEERIIKRLEASCGQQPDCNCEIVISHAIALIEGENK